MTTAERKAIIDAAEAAGWKFRPVIPNYDQAFAFYLVKRGIASVYVSANKDGVIDNAWTGAIDQMSDPTPAKIIAHLKESA